MGSGPGMDRLNQRLQTPWENMPQAASVAPPPGLGQADPRYNGTFYFGGNSGFRNEPPQAQFQPEFSGVPSLDNVISLPGKQTGGPPVAPPSTANFSRVVNPQPTAQSQSGINFTRIDNPAPQLPTAQNPMMQQLMTRFRGLLG